MGCDRATKSINREESGRKKVRSGLLSALVAVEPKQCRTAPCGLCKAVGRVCVCGYRCVTVPPRSRANDWHGTRHLSHQACARLASEFSLVAARASASLLQSQEGC